MSSRATSIGFAAPPPTSKTSGHASSSRSTAAEKTAGPSASIDALRDRLCCALRKHNAPTSKESNKAPATVTSTRKPSSSTSSSAGVPVVFDNLDTILNTRANTTNATTRDPSPSQFASTPLSRPRKSEGATGPYEQCRIVRPINHPSSDIVQRSAAAHLSGRSTSSILPASQHTHTSTPSHNAPFSSELKSTRDWVVRSWENLQDQPWFFFTSGSSKTKAELKRAAEFVPGATGLSNAQRYHPRGRVGYGGVRDSCIGPDENAARTAAAIRLRAEWEISLAREQVMLRMRWDRMMEAELRGRVVATGALGTPEGNEMSGTGINPHSIARPSRSHFVRPRQPRNAPINNNNRNRAVDVGNFHGGSRVVVETAVSVQLGKAEWYVRPRGPSETDAAFWEAVRSDLEFRRLEREAKQERWLRGANATAGPVRKEMDAGPAAAGAHVVAAAGRAVEVGSEAHAKKAVSGPNHRRSMDDGTLRTIQELVEEDAVIGTITKSQRPRRCSAGMLPAAFRT